MATKKIVSDNLRSAMLKIAVDAYIEAGYEILQTAGGTYYIPCVDEEGNDAWFKVAGIIPKTEEGDDGYELAEEFKIKQAAAAERKAKAAAKAEKDKAKREAKQKESSKE